jgi:hypothetical protein
MGYNTSEAVKKLAVCALARKDGRLVEPLEGVTGGYIFPPKEDVSYGSTEIQIETEDTIGEYP